MQLDSIFTEITDFSKEGHGSSNYSKDLVFVEGEQANEFAPYNYLKKKLEWSGSERDLISLGFVLDSLSLHETKTFSTWFEKQFSKKLLVKDLKKITIVSMPNKKVILAALETIDKQFKILRSSKIILNGKNLPVQIGEWAAKSIFGLKQEKSTSQRGFDFYLDGKRVEVKVEWSDISSLKGVKVRRSMAELSEYTIIIYLAQNFMIREVCLLDSEFILRRFAGKGHAIFLKDSDLLKYFFSKSNRHDSKVANKDHLMKFASPVLAMKIAERFTSSDQRA